MTRQSLIFLALGFVSACAGRRIPEAPPASGPVPDRILGIVLRQPLNPDTISTQRCYTGRGFAYEDGEYEIVTDDILFSAPEEHHDTSAVLAALDQFTACRISTRELSATAVVTLSDSVVEHAVIYWPRGDGPSYDRMLAILIRMYGEPFQNAWGVRYWSGDSIKITLNERSPYGPGTTLTMSDARLCERYEELAHRSNSHDRRSFPCWEDSRRLDEAEIFTDPPIALADSDLNVGGLAAGADSTEVRRLLGPPAAADTSSDGYASWTYAGLQIWFERGRLRNIVLITPQHATARGLRVGDHVRRAKVLYGTPCLRELWIYCREVGGGSDGRGMSLEVKDLTITQIRIGIVFSSQ